MNKIKVKVKKLDERAAKPFRVHEGDAGFDLVAVSVEEDRKRNIVSYGTGIAVEIPEGYVGLIFPRSSIYKKDLLLSNAVGVVDSGFRGEVMLKFRCVGTEGKVYEVGERVGQLIILPYPEIEFEEADELSDSDRGTGGYGSTGK